MGLTDAQHQQLGATLYQALRAGTTLAPLTDSYATIDIEDDGTIKVYANDDDALQDCLSRIEAIVAEPEVGMIYEGKITRIVDFGAFVEIFPGTEGLLHISQIAEERVEKVTDFLSEGEIVRVKCIDYDQRGRIKLSLKEAAKDDAAASGDTPAEAAVEAPAAAEPVAEAAVPEADVPVVDEVAEAPVAEATSEVIAEEEPAPAQEVAEESPAEAEDAPEEEDSRGNA